MDNNLRFEEFFAERMREHGFNIKKLADASGVPIKYLEALTEGKFENLPPAPYFRGYLVRLGQVLDFDHEIWWRKLKDGGFTASAGDKDQMPKNRFISKKNEKFIWMGAAILFVAIYFFAQMPRLLGAPEIRITSPAENPAISELQDVVISGTAKNASELKINGEKIALTNGAAWEKNVLLQRGLNSFEISASKFLGGEIKIVQQIIYRPANVTGTEQLFQNTPAI